MKPDELNRLPLSERDMMLEALDDWIQSENERLEEATRGKGKH